MCRQEDEALAATPEHTMTVISGGGEKRLWSVPETRNIEAPPGANPKSKVMMDPSGVGMRHHLEHMPTSDDTVLVAWSGIP